MRSLLTITLCLLLMAFSATQRSDTTKEKPALTGVLWKLAKIQSMDDSTDLPRAPGLYTLEFHKDGSVAIRADCNRGRGNWASETADQLNITQLITTRAMCIPGSLHDQFISDLNDTRSFTLNEGKLYLATMPDGSILEFFSSRAMQVE
jgi:heat shock protein HslJ